jgi:hypothetical protein
MVMVAWAAVAMWLAMVVVQEPTDWVVVVVLVGQIMQVVLEDLERLLLKSIIPIQCWPLLGHLRYPILEIMSTTPGHRMDQYVWPGKAIRCQHLGLFLCRPFEPSLGDPHTQFRLATTTKVGPMWLNIHWLHMCRYRVLLPYRIFTDQQPMFQNLEP